MFPEGCTRFVFALNIIFIAFIKRNNEKYIKQSKTKNLDLERNFIKISKFSTSKRINKLFSFPFYVTCICLIMWMFTWKFTLAPQHQEKKKKKKGIPHLGFLVTYRTQTLFSPDQKSMETKATSDVSQASVISPLVFLMYSIMIWPSVLFFADDRVVYDLRLVLIFLSKFIFFSCNLNKHALVQKIYFALLRLPSVTSWKKMQQVCE